MGSGDIHIADGSYFGGRPRRVVAVNPAPPTTPAPAMPNCVRCGRIRMGEKDCSCGPNGEPIPAHIAAELTTLRQRLAEAEADLKQMTQHADAWKEAFDREWKRAEKAEADAARWEGAARKLPEAREAFLWWYSVDKAFIEGLADKPALDAAMARLRTTLEITE